MSHQVFCTKLKEQLPGLPYPPFKGELGRRVYSEISEKAWKLWLGHSTMVINEYRLNPAEEKAQKILREQLEKFLFGTGAKAPDGFVPQDTATKD